VGATIGDDRRSLVVIVAWPEPDEREADVQGDPLDHALRTVVAQHLDVPPSDLTGEFPFEQFEFDEDLAARLLDAVGDELEVRFPDDFLDGLGTYGQFHHAVRLAVGV
jgi:hypothetical protein